MKSRLLLLAGLCLALTSQAQQVVYENLSTNNTPLAGYSEPNANNPIFGDALNLTQGGKLGNVGLTLFNSSSGGNTGSIIAGNMTLNIYNNTVPYAGGSLSASDPLIASVLLTWNFAPGALAPGFFSIGTFDLTALNITVPQNIFVTQQFTQTLGTSTRNGVVLFTDPVVGTSPANVYINSSATAEGLYTFSGNPNQFGYHIEIQIVPEPSSLALAGLGGAALLIFRRRK
jgi:PEP-CTERM putative exosortase interaction domain